MLGGYFISRKSKKSHKKRSMRRSKTKSRSFPREPVVVPSRFSREENDRLLDEMGDYLYKNSQRKQSRIGLSAGYKKKKRRS
jgi:hypothetical protein